MVGFLMESIHLLPGIYQMSLQPFLFGLKGSWKPVGPKAIMCTESLGTFDHGTVDV